MFEEIAGRTTAIVPSAQPRSGRYIGDTASVNDDDARPVDPDHIETGAIKAEKKRKLSARGKLEALSPDNSNSTIPVEEIAIERTMRKRTTRK